MGPTASLSIYFPAAETPPVEFRIFAAGWNATDKGKFLFDAEAAASVMAAYEAQGTDRMIDLEHLSLDDAKPHYDPDARGWAHLEVRPDGSLWAVDVKWTPDGQERLANKTQRYISPTFLYDRKSLRVTRIWNIAMTAQPATFRTAPLVAARRGKDMSISREQLGGITMEQMQQMAEIMGLAPDAPLADIIATFAGGAKELQDAANGGASEEDAAPDSSADVAMAEPPVDPGAPDAPAPKPGAAGPPKPEDKKAAMAASSRIMQLSGKATITEAADEVEVWRTSHLTLESERLSLAKDRAVLESAERRKLVTELVTLGAEFPATVWADDKSKTIKSRWLKMDIAELRSHVTEQRGARGNKKPPAPPPRGSGGSGPVDGVASLSANELAICKEQGCDPAVYATLKAHRNSVQSTGGI